MTSMAEAVRRLRIEASSTGVTKTTGEVQNLGKAMGTVTVASQQKERATLSLEKRLASIQRQYDLNFRAEQALVKVTRDLNAAEGQGLITTTRKNQLLALAAERHGAAAAATTAHSRAIAGLTAASASATATLRSMLLPLAAVLGPAILARNFIQNSIEQQRVEAQLEAVIRSTGGAAGYTSGELTKMASALQGLTTYGDEAVVGAESILLTFTKISRDVFPEALQATLDMSTALGTDLKGSAIQIGKALNDPIKGITALTRAGVSFTDSQKATIKALVESGRLVEAQRLELAELRTEFGGSAAAAKMTLGGALASLKNAFGDLFEVSNDGSTRLIESVNRLTATMSDPKTITAVQNFGGALFDAFAKTINFLRKNGDLLPVLGGAYVGARFGPVGALAGAALGETQTHGVRDYIGRQTGMNIGSLTGLSPEKAAILDRILREAQGIPSISAEESISKYDAGRRYITGMPRPTAAPLDAGPAEDQISAQDRLQKQFDAATVALHKQTSALMAQSSALGLSVGAAAEYTKQQELLNLAEQNGLTLSADKIAAINAEAAAYGRATQALAEMRALRDLRFDASQLGRTNTEQSIASTLRGIYGDDWQSQANGAIASQIRFNETLKLSQDLATGFASSFLGDLRNGATAVDALTNSLTKLGDRLLDMALDVAIQKLVASLFALGAGTGVGTGVGSSSFGGLAASIYHDGGVAGAGGATRYVHPAYFDNAPRYHSGGIAGLRPNEIPAILERGERISRKGEAAGGGNVEVNVYAPPGSNVRQEQSRSGNDVKIDVFVEQIEGMMSKRVVENRSKLGSAIASTHGLRRVGR